MPKLVSPRATDEQNCHTVCPGLAPAAPPGGPRSDVHRDSATAAPGRELEHAHVEVLRADFDGPLRD
eukprot:8141439-Pyramimonas_sp.AAC.1